MEGSEAKRLRLLESENAKLKQLLAEEEQDKAALKKLVEGKVSDGRARMPGSGTTQESPHQRTPSLCRDGIQPHDRPVSSQWLQRYRFADPTVDIGEAVSSLWCCNGRVFANPQRFVLFRLP